MLRLLDRFRPAPPAVAQSMADGSDLSDVLRHTGGHEWTGAEADALGAEDELARIVALARDLER